MVKKKHYIYNNTHLTFQANFACKKEKREGVGGVDSFTFIGCIRFTKGQNLVSKVV